MEYDMPLYRPPSEARSLIFQVTHGCSWNRCMFCAMYKTKQFAVRPFADIERDIVSMSRELPDTRRVFLADGDALTCDTSFLVRTLDCLNEQFPRLERVGTYAGPTNLRNKTVDDLVRLKQRKLDVCYLGIETGHDPLLKKIRKGATAAQIIEGCGKIKQAGLRLSTIILLGLGGEQGSHAHAKDSARVVNAIDPDFLACLTLMLGPYQDLYEQELMGDGFTLPDKQGILRELRWFTEDLDVTSCRFGTEHASNYLPIHGDLPRDREKILALIDQGLEDRLRLRPDWMRGL